MPDYNHFHTGLCRTFAGSCANKTAFNAGRISFVAAMLATGLSLADPIVLSAQKATPAATVAKGTQGQFVILKGTDTVAVENFFRDASVLTGQIAQNAGPRSEYTMLLRPDSRIEHVDNTRKFRAGGQVTVTLELLDKAVNGSVTTAEGSERFDINTAVQPTPFLVFSFALAEQIVRAAALPVGKSAKYLAMRLGSADTATVTVSRFHADSASLIMADVGMKVALAADGRVVGGTHTAQPWIVRRTR